MAEIAAKGVANLTVSTQKQFEEIATSTQKQFEEMAISNQKQFDELRTGQEMIMTYLREKLP